jgi:Protein of unknown function (DUF3574)
MNTFAQSILLSGLALIYTSSFDGFITQESIPVGQRVPETKAQAHEPMYPPLCKTMSSSRVFTRTELFFGLAKPDGSEVTEAEFQRFLNREVTPRFPDGLTLLSGRGQFKNSGGVIVREPSRLLIVLYPIEALNRSSQKIEQISKAYKDAFREESVLRTDEQTCVSF